MSDATDTEFERALEVFRRVRAEATTTSSRHIRLTADAALIARLLTDAGDATATMLSRTFKELYSTSEGIAKTRVRNALKHLVATGAASRQGNAASPYTAVAKRGRGGRRTAPQTAIKG